MKISLQSGHYRVAVFMYLTSTSVQVQSYNCFSPCKYSIHRDRSIAINPRDRVNTCFWSVIPTTATQLGWTGLSWGLMAIIHDGNANEGGTIWSIHWRTRCRGSISKRIEEVLWRVILEHSRYLGDRRIRELYSLFIALCVVLFSEMSPTC